MTNTITYPNLANEDRSTRKKFSNKGLIINRNDENPENTAKAVFLQVHAAYTFIPLSEIPAIIAALQSIQKDFASTEEI